jgi:uncharacterized transporter YbjL
VQPPGGHLPAAITDHALAVGFSRGFLVSAGIAMLAFVITLAVIRVKRADLAGAQAAAPSMPVAAETADAR